jgi:pimeloyl-ACP methyl ester carboxylesterase
VKTPATTWKEDFVAVDGFQIRYLEAGTGDPLVVVHGASGLRRSVGYDLLTSDHRVVLLEMPGFGSSPENQRSQSIDELAETLVVAVRSLVEVPCDLLGHSFGGAVAATMAYAHPELVRALVLSAPAALLPEGLAIHDVLHSSASSSVEDPYGPPTVVIASEIVARQDALVERLAAAAAEIDVDVRLAAIGAPTLVVWGTEDQVIPPELAPRYRAAIPNCHLTYLYGAGHRPDAYRPQAFAALVHDFLLRKEAFLVRNTSGLLYP